jgi:ribosomal protein S18 acetylase RimI-like enzyme
MPEQEPIYRQAGQDDAGAIAALGSQILDELGEASGLPGPMTPADVAGRLAGYAPPAPQGGRPVQPKGAMFVCQLEKGICGFAALEPDPQAEGGAVMGVWLLPAARGQGRGRELALMALEFARNAGYRKVRGTLPENNEAALSFFSEIGALAQVVGAGMQYELPL